MRGLKNYFKLYYSGSLKKFLGLLSPKKSKYFELQSLLQFLNSFWKYKIHVKMESL